MPKATSQKLLTRNKWWCGGVWNEKNEWRRRWRRKRRARLPALLSSSSPITYHFQRHLDWNLIFLVGTHLFFILSRSFCSSTWMQRGDEKWLSSTLVKKGMLCSQTTTQCRQRHPAASHLEGQFVKNNECWLVRARPNYTRWLRRAEPISGGDRRTPLCRAQIIEKMTLIKIWRVNQSHQFVTDIPRRWSKYIYGYIKCLWKWQKEKVRTALLLIFPSVGWQHCACKF